jgi:hypothetical protein
MTTQSRPCGCTAGQVYTVSVNVCSCCGHDWPIRREPFVGQHVIANGYRGTITRVCEWSDSMVEVRLASGTVCVDFNGIDCRAA